METYIKNVDYKIKNGTSTGGRPEEIIMITPECFKRLCMSSKTLKAEEVRTYFIEIEKHLDKYKNYIIEGLNKSYQSCHCAIKSFDKGLCLIVYFTH